MLQFKITKDADGEDLFEVEAEGLEIIHNPILNKEDAFPLEERLLFKIDGFFPPAVSTLETQIARTYENFNLKISDIEKYIFLRSLQDRNETLFYATLLRYLEEMLPIVYTPTVGFACQRYSHIFRFSRGIFLSPLNIDRAEEIFQSLPYKHIEMIVVTDSEGILGIGDQGAGGMPIPIGKLALYVAGAGIHPGRCLPVTLDVGTDNEERLSDPLYIGIRQRRLRGEAYFEFVDKFVKAVKKVFPMAVLQWEDFSKQNAVTLLEKYRKELPSFNDDIQGTGAVVLAGIMNALKIKGEKLAQQVFVIYGAGAGGIGTANQILSAIMEEGLSEQDALGRIFILDSKGLLYEGRGGIEDYKKRFSRPAESLAGWERSGGEAITLLDTVTHARATVLLGLSGRSGDFKEEVVRRMLENCDRPIIFPLSNPTDKAEAKPEDLYRWTDGMVIVATGSPFPDVNFKGRVFKVGQGNNAFIFPGVGLGALVVGARVITDEMLSAAANCLADMVSDSRLGLGCVYPAISELRNVTKEIGLAVARKAIEQGVAASPMEPETLKKVLTARMWIPKYARFVKGIQNK